MEVHSFIEDESYVDEEEQTRYHDIIYIRLTDVSAWRLAQAIIQKIGLQQGKTCDIALVGTMREGYLDEN